MDLDLPIAMASIAHALLRLVGLSQDHAYKVIVKGKPLWWLEGDKKEVGGFYTTRIVMADSRRLAIERAIELVKHEVGAFAKNPADDPVVVQAEQCMEVSGIVMRQISGFTFWGEPAPKCDSNLLNVVH